jgi:uncharacterized protein with GYD domain
MKRRIAFVVTSLMLLAPGPGFVSGDAVGQQASAVHHRYLFRAAFTVEGMQNLQKQSATGFKTGVAKFFESVGGKLESWYFDYGDSTAYGFVDYPDEIAAATAQASVNAGGFARVSYRAVLSAEDADKALARSVATRPPQQQ